MVNVIDSGLTNSLLNLDNKLQYKFREDRLEKSIDVRVVRRKGARPRFSPAGQIVSRAAHANGNSSSSVEADSQQSTLNGHSPIQGERVVHEAAARHSYDHLNMPRPPKSSAVSPKAARQIPEITTDDFLDAWADACNAHNAKVAARTLRGPLPQSGARSMGEAPRNFAAAWLTASTGAKAAATSNHG